MIFNFLLSYFVWVLNDYFIKKENTLFFLAENERNQCRNTAKASTSSTHIWEISVSETYLGLDIPYHYFALCQDLVLIFGPLTKQ